MKDNFCNFSQFFQRPQIALALRAREILLVFKKTYSCLFIPNWNHENHVITYKNCTLFISIILVINQSCNETFKAQHGWTKNKNIVNIFKVIYLLQ